MTKVQTLITAFVVGLMVMWAATSLMAQQFTTEVCIQTADTIIRPIVEGRDNGVPREDMMAILGTIGFDFERAWNLTGMVYDKLADKNPEEVVADFMDWCAGNNA
jgi:hypothetical protein